MPEFDIDYKNTCIKTLTEAKPFKNEKIKYYPGFVFTYKTVRNPYSKMKKAFFPTIALGVFLICVY